MIMRRRCRRSIACGMSLKGRPKPTHLEILVTLVEAYEKGRYELPPPDPIEALEYFVESRGWTRKDLEPYIGSRGRVSEIMSRKRPLTITMIRNLERATGIPAVDLDPALSDGAKTGR